MFDLAVLRERQRLWLPRRRMIQLMAGVSLAAMFGCGDDDDPTAASDSDTSSSSATSSSSSSPSSATTSGPGTGSTGSASDCTEIPEETAGPFPGDGSNGPNVLNQSGVVRRDITKSFGSMSGTAAGVPLAVTVTILDGAKNCAALSGAAVYLWQCDQTGGYSLYSQGVTNQNYLRGVQEADANGRVTFQSIFPGAYSGRWPHIHFEVFPSLAKAATVGNKIATSQIALPEDACKLVYATDGYSASVRNLAQTSLARDNVFGGDSGAQQLGTISGDVRSGFAVELPVTVKA